jgi:hypothetical protein
MSSRKDTEESESEPLKPESLRLPQLSAVQMQRGLADLRRMDRQQLQNIAALVSSTDPRLLETVFRAQGIAYSAEDIAKLAAVLTSNTVDKIASIAQQPPAKPDLSQTIARRLHQDPQLVQRVLHALYLLSLPCRISYVLLRALMTGPRKFYFIPAVVGLVCYAITQMVEN